MEAAALDEPVDLELDAGVDQVVEAAARLLQGQCVRVDELVADEEVDLRGQVEEGHCPSSCRRFRADLFGGGGLCRGGAPKPEESGGHQVKLNWRRGRYFSY